MSALPTPSAASQQHSQQLSDLVQQTMLQQGGWISFAEFMQMALYTPALGYYSGGLQKFGDIHQGGGDFVTAPELTPLFAQALANQVAEVLHFTQGDVLELGAGTGRLAAGLLLALADLDQLPARYCILEVSGHLRDVQLETLKEKLPEDLLQRVVWLDAMPEDFVGMMLGNEVLDAIPVHLLTKQNDTWLARGVVFDDGFKWQDQPLQDDALLASLPAENLPNGYLTEVCPAAIGLINSLATALKQGVLLMLDYGFGAAEYYHPQRDQGTLMCHYQHYAHSDPLINLGLQDITAHVNFTAIVEAGIEQGLLLQGYTNQAQFLMNCGLLDLLARVSPEDSTQYAPMAAAVQKLMSPAEMGELFKVVAFSKEVDVTLTGFERGDKSHML